MSEILQFIVKVNELLGGKFVFSALDKMCRFLRATAGTAIARLQSITGHISETVRDRAKVTINH